MTSHLLTDGFVSGNYFFYPPRLSFFCSLPSASVTEIKQKKNVALPWSCGVFVRFFFFFKKECRVGVALYAVTAAAAAPATATEEEEQRRGSMRQQHQQEQEPKARREKVCSSAVVPRVVTVWADRAEPSTRRDLGWLLWIQKADKRARRGQRAKKRAGRETLTDNGVRERVEQCRCDGGGAAECSVSEQPLGSESRESKSERNPPPPRVPAPFSDGHAHEWEG